MLQSPPSWRRGLKSSNKIINNNSNRVASFLEAWIEMLSRAERNRVRGIVASFLEAWIEICRNE